MPSDASFAQDPEAARWHYRPADPVALNPLFTWPLNLKSVFDWYRGAWLQITSVSICFVLALAVWFIFIPPLEAMQTFSPNWMFRVWLANLLPQILVAGTLHWWLYILKGQGNHKKFEARDPTRSSGHFSFGNQVRDNVFWTLGSAITVATIYQWVIFWCMANSYVPTVTFAENPVWCIIWLALIPMWSSLHYYWAHRLEHHPRLYPRFHAVHHRNVTTGPWTGISNHWLENLLYFTTYWVHLIIPSHPLHLTWHAMFQQVTPTFSHSGFERVVVADKGASRAGDFFHQLHHRYFECNYGTSEIPFDRWFGTFHDGSAAATARTRAHKKQMNTK